ncbi:MAG: DUF948 domain-containing protein [Actinobacteria bacterium]|nr:DUF948 domain-containing protein [Actinomycetota bacterium]
MTVRDWAIVAGALFWGVLVVMLCLLVMRAMKLLDSVIGTVGRVTDETVPILRGVTDTVAGVNVELARVDTIVAGVQSITSTTDRIVGVVHAILANPLIKAAAVAAGTAKAARALRD